MRSSWGRVAPKWSQAPVWRNAMLKPDIDQMPPPSFLGMIFNLLMFLMPIIGMIIFGPIGLIIGATISCIGLYTFFFGKRRKGSKCDICNRPTVNLGRGTRSADSMNIGTFMNVSGIMSGREGPGDECLKCGRVYCTDCAQIDMKCECGSIRFRTVRLRYE